MVPEKPGKWNDLEFHCWTNGPESNARTSCVTVTIGEFARFARYLFFSFFSLLRSAGIAHFCSAIAYVSWRVMTVYGTDLARCRAGERNNPLLFRARSCPEWYTEKRTVARGIDFYSIPRDFSSEALLNSAVEECGKFSNFVDGNDYPFSAESWPQEIFDYVGAYAGLFGADQWGN